MRKIILNSKISTGSIQKLSIWMVLAPAFILAFGLIPIAGISDAAALDLADAPLLNKSNPPPPNLMILMDDSWSMGYDILVSGRFGGEFENPEDGTADKVEGFCYYFDDMFDGYKFPTGAYRQMDAEDRKYWRTQWHEVNALYYNPNQDYDPWPEYGTTTFSDADPDEPLAHAFETVGTKTIKRLDLEAKALAVKDDEDESINIPWAHYFVKGSDDVVYLVVMEDGEVSYYTFTTDNKNPPTGDKIEIVTLIEDLDNVPDDIEVEYDDARQNFANWFRYHRRREFIAKVALATVIKDLSDIRVGILGLNKRVKVPLKPVKAFVETTTGSELKDETDTLIEKLYEYRSQGSTPLKQGLQNIGNYYKNNDGKLPGTTETGDVPYAASNGACQMSFAVVVTDGYYTDQSHTSTDVANADNNTNFDDWGGGKQPYKDDYANTLADFAMYYYATDLLPSFENAVPTSSVDKAPHQHMVTFGVALGVKGKLTPEDYYDDRTQPNYLQKKSDNSYVVWPQVTGNQQAESVDDLWHATVNGRGVFINAGEPKKLNDGLTRIIEDILDRNGSAASVAVNGDPMFAVVNKDTVLFQGSYSNKEDEWNGDLEAYRVLNPSTNKVNPSPIWKPTAAKLLNDQSITPWNSRLIATFNGKSGTAGAGIEFDYDHLTTKQKTAVGNDSEVVNFIRGKSGISGFRERKSLLGDIVHSAPTYHNKVVYVGANDGMLHAFDADDGKELFAYVPNLLFSNPTEDGLVQLTKTDYFDNHKYYVDLTPTAADGIGIFGGTDTERILVGGLGKGGKGYFALDITNVDPGTYPASMNQLKSMVKWEFPRGDESTSASDIKNLGYSFSKSVVVKSYLEDSTTGKPKWVVIFGNGYNSQTENALLYILDAADGSVITTIDTKTTSGNGLSTPIAVDVDYDFIVDYVYAGDLKGNLWKFDLKSNDKTQWKVAYGTTTNPKPLFTATDDNGNPQPITTRPEAAYHPKHGYFVFFGTGKYIENADPDDEQLQTVYGIWDYGDNDDDEEYLGTLDRSSGELSNSGTSSEIGSSVYLLKQEVDDTIKTTLAGRTIRTLTDNKIEWNVQPDYNGNGTLDDPTKHVGWYFDLPFTGERVVSDITLRGGKVIFIGFTPTDKDCESGGRSMLMEIDWETGGRLAGVNLDVTDDGKIDEDDEAEDKDKTKKVPPSGLEFFGMLQRPVILLIDKEGEMKFMSSSDGSIQTVIEKGIKLGVSYWMEVHPD